MKRIIIAALCAAAAALPVTGYNGDYGTESVFTLGAGARSIALGGAYTALSGDAGGAAYNPAGTAWMKKQQVLLMVHPLYEGALLGSASYGLPLLEFGTIGGAFYSLSAGGIDGYDENDLYTGQFDFGEYKGSLYYAKEINEVLSVGIRANLYGISTLNINSAGFGADAGVLYRPFPFLYAGITLENIIKPSINLTSGSEDIPQRYTLGTAFVLENAGLSGLVSADFSLGERENFKYKAGVEVGYAQSFFLRAGLNDGIITAGAGLSFADIGIDYAYSLNEYMGGVSVFNLSYSFGLTIDEQKKEKAKAIREEVKRLVDSRISKEMEAKADLFYEKAYAMFDSAKYEEALDELQKALEWYPSHFKANRLRSWIKFRIKELYYNAAVANFEREDYIRAIENLKTLEKYDGNYMNAAAYQREVNKKLGLSSREASLFAAGVEFYIKKQYNDAINRWKRVLDSKPDNVTVKNYIRQAEEFKSTAVVQVKKEATKAEKDKSEALYFQAVDVYTSGETQKAVALWEEAIRLNPDNIRAQRDLEKARVEIQELRRRGL